MQAWGAQPECPWAPLTFARVLLHSISAIPASVHAGTLSHQASWSLSSYSFPFPPQPRSASCLNSSRPPFTSSLLYKKLKYLIPLNCGVAKPQEMRLWYQKSPPNQATTLARFPGPSSLLPSAYPKLYLGCPSLSIVL